MTRKSRQKIVDEQKKTAKTVLKVQISNNMYRMLQKSKLLVYAS